MAIGVWISLFAYFALMIGIGLYAMRTSTSTSEDYVLGGRTLSPKVAALSAGASEHEWLAAAGFTWRDVCIGPGLCLIGIGLFVGAFFNWLLVAPRLREQTVHYGNAITIPAFLANRFPDPGNVTENGLGDCHRHLFRGLHPRQVWWLAVSCLKVHFLAW